MVLFRRNKLALSLKHLIARVARHHETPHVQFLILFSWGGCSLLRQWQGPYSGAPLRVDASLQDSCGEVALVCFSCLFFINAWGGHWRQGFPTLFCDLCALPTTQGYPTKSGHRGYKPELSAIARPGAISGKVFEKSLKDL